jgi:peroxin-6
MLKAVTRQASLVDSKIVELNSSPEQQRKGTKISTANFFDHYATKEDVAVMVTEEDFLKAQKELIPSVSAGELEHYQKVRQQFEKVAESESENNINGGDIPLLQGDGLAKPNAKGKEAMLTFPERPRSKGKGKEKVVDRKGKGKARSWNEEDEDEDDGYDASASLNGHTRKGQGKAIDMRFQESEADDDGLY